MRSWTIVAFTLLFSAMATVYANTAPGQADAGWITLFDGKNLDHWRGDGKANFVVEDGSVIAKDKKDPDPKAIAFLISRQSFKDFQLRAEFWISEDGNSGVFLRVVDANGPISSKVGYEPNIFDTRPDPSFGTGALLPFAKALTVLKTGGKWNTYDITAKGPKFTMLLNGVKTVEGEDSQFPEGPIALQFGQGTVKFRKIEIRPL